MSYLLAFMVLFGNELKYREMDLVTPQNLIIVPQIFFFFLGGNVVL